MSNQAAINDVSPRQSEQTRSCYPTLASCLVVVEIEALSFSQLTACDHGNDYRSRLSKYCSDLSGRLVAIFAMSFRPSMAFQRGILPLSYASSTVDPKRMVTTATLPQATEIELRARFNMVNTRMIRKPTYQGVGFNSLLT